MYVLILILACTAPSDGQLLSSSAYMSLEHADVQQITYASQGLRIQGMVAIPHGEGPFPLVWFNHGGFSGIRDNEVQDLGQRAHELQAVVAASMYRGEGDSEGVVEYCQGEVADVFNIEAASEQLVELDDRRVAIGSSHGACISLMLNADVAAADRPLLASVTLGTPTDVDALMAWHYAEGNPRHAMTWEPFVGSDGTDMSPLFADLSPPIILLHGLDDELVPLAQACLLRDELEPLWPTASHGFQPDMSPSEPGPVETCQGAIEAGPTSPLPDGLRLISFEGAGHVPPDRVWDYAWSEVGDALVHR